jgi:hypothetical protein
MQNVRKRIARMFSGGFWPPLVIALFSALEFSWLERVLDNPLISALLTIVTPLPIASFLSARASTRPRPVSRHHSTGSPHRQRLPID